MAKKGVKSFHGRTVIQHSIQLSSNTSAPDVSNSLCHIACSVCNGHW